jgi:hypothetical protein
VNYNFFLNESIELHYIQFELNYMQIQIELNWTQILKLNWIEFSWKLNEWKLV